MDPRLPHSIVKVGQWIVGILVVDIVVVAVHGRLLVVGSVGTTQIGPCGRILWLLSLGIVVGRRTPDDRLSDPTDPIVLFLFGIGIQQIGNLGSGNLEGVALAGFQIGGFDGGAECQIDHPVGCRVLVGTVKEFGALEQKEAAAPVLTEEEVLENEIAVSAKQDFGKQSIHEQYRYRYRTLVQYSPSTTCSAWSKIPRTRRCPSRK